MKALVTGATGFVGSHLAEALRRRGDEVTALVRSPKKAEALAPLGVRVVAGDLDDAGSLVRAVEGQEVVFHVAGLVAARARSEFMRCNRDGTASLVAAATGRGRVALRPGVLDGRRRAGRTGQAAHRQEPARPVTAYGRSKLAAEAAVTAGAFPGYRAPADGVRTARSRGAQGLPDGALGVAPVFGDGSQQLSAVHGADLANALVAAGTAPRDSRQVYYACHPEVATSAEFVRAVGSAMGRRLSVVPILRRSGGRCSR